MTRVVRHRFDPDRVRLGLDPWTFAALDDFKRLVAAAYLFWPRFVEVKGCVLLGERYDAANLDEWLSLLEGDRSRVEAVVNYVYLGDVLLNLSPEAEMELTSAGWSGDAVLELAEVIALCWRAALSETFPDKTFVVGVDERHDDLPAVFFHADRRRPSHRLALRLPQGFTRQLR